MPHGLVAAAPGPLQPVLAAALGPLTMVLAAALGPEMVIAITKPNCSFPTLKVSKNCEMF